MSDIMSGKIGLVELFTFCFSMATILVGVYYRKNIAKVMTNMRMAVTTLVAGILLLATWSGSRQYQSLQYDAKVQDYVVAAYKTDDKDKAKQYLTNALSYLKDKGANQGHAAIFAGGQTDDLREWYNDLSKIVDAIDTKDVSFVSTPQGTKVEEEGKKGVWKKPLRNLNYIKCDQNENGEDMLETVKFQYPAGMSVAPYNFHYFAWMLSGLSLLAIGVAWLTLAIKKKNKNNMFCDHCCGTGMRMI